jgi:site-specific DNA-methyltransferase (cytosine-N4-specific)
VDADLGQFFSRLDECRDKTPHVHGLHPYPAKFIPHIPRALIRALARPGDVVLDPMCGSGTTLVEAAISGHSSVGVDLNPIATLVSRAKVANLSADDRLALRAVVATLHAAGNDAAAGRLPEATVPEFHNRDKWFAPNVSAEIAYAKSLITSSLDNAPRDVALCALSSVLVAVSNQESETRWCAKPRDARDGTALAKIATKLADTVERIDAYQSLRPAPVEVYTADALAIPLEDGTVGTVITSPPYANSHDYYLYNKLRMFWLGEDVAHVQRNEIGSRNRHSDMKETIDTYALSMSQVLRECRRVTLNGGTLAIVVGDSVIRRELFDMSEIYNALAESAGFVHEQAHRFGHRRFNASFQRGFGTKRQKDTHVLVYRAN